MWKTIAIVLAFAVTAWGQATKPANAPTKPWSDLKQMVTAMPPEARPADREAWTDGLRRLAQKWFHEEYEHAPVELRLVFRETGEIERDGAGWITCEAKPFAAVGLQFVENHFSCKVGAENYRRLAKTKAGSSLIVTGTISEVRLQIVQGETNKLVGMIRIIIKDAETR